MTLTTALCSFALVVGLLTLTPGLDTALILRTAALGRRRRAVGVVLGIQTGTLLWGSLTSLGITALLTASHLAYDVVRLAGAGYLLWMGARMLWNARHPAAARSEAVDGLSADRTDSLFQGWRQGTATNLLNPKVGVFYVAVLPQFIPAGAPHFATGVLLTCVHVAQGLLWSSVLVLFAHAVRGWLQRPAARRALDRITGLVILGFGLRLAAGE